MTQIILLLTHHGLITFDSPLTPAELITAIADGSWQVPEPYHELLPAKPGTRLRAFAVHDQVVVGLSGCLRLPPAAPPQVRLTMRQQQVLGGLAAGRTSSQIALELGVSTRVVDYHVEMLKKRLGVQSRAQAVMRAAALGIELG